MQHRVTLLQHTRNTVDTPDAELRAYTVNVNLIVSRSGAHTVLDSWTEIHQSDYKWIVESNAFPVCRRLPPTYLRQNYSPAGEKKTSRPINPNEALLWIN